MAENPRNIDTYYIIKVSLVLRIAYVVPKNQDRIVFYVNNYIDQDQFNQLYDTDWFNKDV